MRRKKKKSKSPPRMVLALAALAAAARTAPRSAGAFVPAPPPPTADPLKTGPKVVSLFATAPAGSGGGDPFDSPGLVRRAREVLEKSKAKLAAREEEEGGPAAAAAGAGETPFFARRSLSRDVAVKSRDAETGLITADGEALAAISEQEDWEMRPLNEVFENEMSENEDVYSLASQQLAQRDVAQSVWNLRKQLQTEDYQRIFDKRNRFIGEDS